MRYFVQCSYCGTRYAGWQRQPNDPSVQQTIEEALSLLLAAPVEITGCGRTDAGVHASHYIFHFDTTNEVPENLVYRLNRMLPVDIALNDAYPVGEDVHARFSATSRSYRYDIVFRKDPLRHQFSWQYPFSDRLDLDLLDEVADTLMRYSEFSPFCKTGSDTTHFRCDLHEARWERLDDGLAFHITANRFLRGMVRLMVGTSMQVARSKIPLQVLRAAMEAQSLIPGAESAPANGLFLVDVRYPQ